MGLRVSVASKFAVLVPCVPFVLVPLVPMLPFVGKVQLFRLFGLCSNTLDAPEGSADNRCVIICV